MANRLRRWLELPSHERRQVLVLAAALPVISVALRLFGYRRTRAWLERRTRHASPRTAGSVELAQAERYAQLAAIAGRHGAIRSTCLRQALAVYAWLRERGFRPELKLGIDKSNQHFDAHAWVELQGRPLAQQSMRHTSF